MRWHFVEKLHDIGLDGGTLDAMVRHLLLEQATSTFACPKVAMTAACYRNKDN